MSTPQKNPHPHQAYDIVDSQLHLSLDLTEEKISLAMNALGIGAIIFDELWSVNAKYQSQPCVTFADGSYRALSPGAQVAALKNPQQFSYLQRVSRTDPNVQEYITLLASSPGCRYLRLVLLYPGEREAFINGDYHLLLEQAQTLGLPVSILAQEVGTMLPEIASQYPQLQFVLDHCGWPKSTEQWEQVLVLAQLPNVWLKWSHFYKPFYRGDNPSAALQQQFMRAVNTFGADRILWASDFTHEESSASWSELLGFVKDNPELTDSQKAEILGGTARRVFQWPSAQ